ncbi:MAG: ROK family protein [Actinomycetota bacterium]|nr:ROK family protein [Actinomycetota bacterium]
MSEKLLSLVKPKIQLPLDDNFQPAVLFVKAFNENLKNTGRDIPLWIGIEKEEDSVLVYETGIFKEESDFSSYNFKYIELLAKTLLWMYGGYKIIIGGSKKIGEHLKNVYSEKGKRSFDAKFMSGIYEKPFEVVSVDIERIPSSSKKSIVLGGHLDGCRIGFDLGASDRKVSASIDGKVVYSEEIVWNPGKKTDPGYHYHEIMSMLHHAASHMPRVDAIGGSSAGIYINNRVMNASIFRGIPEDLFNKKVRNIFLDIQDEWGVPLKVINDGEVTALAGSMSLKKNAVLGIAMGSSEAGGYINKKGNINGWLNELAFIPIDLNDDAPVDEWSGEKGCGVQYLSQLAAVRLAEKAGINPGDGITPAGKLKIIQGMVTGGNKQAKKIFDTIGCYLGYGIAYYSQFYEIETVLILGRVTSGEGGQVILQKARQVLEEEFPGLADKITINLPDESSRRVGQSIAAASLPLIDGRK